MAEYSFVVAGLPKGQPRPRAFARMMGARAVARVYESGTAEGWKGDIAIASAKSKPDRPLSGPVRVDITWLLPRPKRLMRRVDPEGEMPCTAKPDRDNLDKAVLDAMTRLGWWADDAQVYAGYIEKLYHAKSGRPGARVKVYGESQVQP
jgi:Holliday junction resolvase RusA-like endonuclease